MNIEKLEIRFKNAFLFLYSLLLGITPFLMFHRTSEIFEFNKIIFTYLLTIFIMFVWMLRMVVLGRFVFRNTRFTIPILLFLLSQIIATIFSIDVHTSIFGYYGRFNGGLLSTISYALLYFAFVSNIDLSKPMKTVERFMKISLVSSSVVILWGIPSKFGIDFSCKLFTGSFKTSCWTAEFQPMERIFSTLGQPNWLGAYLLINFCFAIYFIFARHLRNLEKNLRTEKSKLASNFLYIYVFLNILAIVFTRSRSTMLALGVVVLGFGLYLARYVYKGHIKKLVPIASIIVVAVIVAHVVSPATKSAPEVKQLKGNKTYTNITDSFEIRKFVWQGGYSLGMKNLLNGTGVETFAYAFNFIRPLDHNLTNEWDFIYNKAHNEFIHYFATTGLFGVLSYMLMIGLVFATSVQIFKEKKETKRLLFLALILAYASIVITNFVGFSTVTISLFFFLIPAMISLLMLPKKSDNMSDLPQNMKLADETALTDVPLLKKVGITSIIMFLLVGIGYISLYFSADVHYAKAENYRLSEQFDQALFYLYYADDLKPEHVYKDRIAQVLTQKGFIDGFSLQTNDPQCPAIDGTTKNCFILADEYSDQAMNSSPQNVYYLRTKARDAFLSYQVTLNEKEFERALDVMMDAQAMAPTDPRYPYMRSVFYMGRYDVLENPSIDDTHVLRIRAASAAETAIKIKPDYKEAYVSRAIIHDALGEKKEAIEKLNFVLENIDPNDMQARAELERIKASQ